MSVLKGAQDFYWYKAELDLQQKYQHRHSGEPIAYPCRVISEWSDDPNGPYCYDHKFIYQEEIECEKCGNKTKHLPNPSELT